MKGLQACLVAFGDLDIRRQADYVLTFLRLFRGTTAGIGEGSVWISDILLRCAFSTLA